MSSMAPKHDAVVIGAGPAGSATATYLARAGFDVLLLDRARFPRPKPCAEYVSPGAVEALRRLGALEGILDEAPAQLRGMRVVGLDGGGFTGRFLRGMGLSIPRERLDLHIAAAAERAGARFLQGVTFESLALAPGGIAVRGRSDGLPFEVRSRIVVGADGLNTRVARQLGVARRSGPRRAALVAHALGVTGMSDVGEMHVGPVGYVGLAPLAGGITNLALVVDLTRDHIGTPVSSAFREHLARFPALRGRLKDLEILSPVRAVGPFGRTTRRAGAERALLVGDAADFYDPFTGEGVYAALVGAELAAEAAADALMTDRLSARHLARYDRRRREAFTAKWTLERIVSWVVSRPWALGHVAARMRRRPELGDLLVSVTAHAAPSSRVFRPSYAWRLVA